MWKDLIQNITYPHYKINLPEPEKVRLNLLYRILLLSLSISFSFLLVNLITGNTNGIYNNIFTISYNLFCIYQFRKSKFSAVRTAFIIGSCLYIYYLHQTNKQDTGAYYFFFPLAAGSVLFYNERERIQMFLTIALPAILLVVCTNNDIELFPDFYPNRTINKINYTLSMSASLFASIYLVYYFFKLYNYSNEKIAQQNASLQSLICNLSDPIWQIDTTFKLTQYNESFNTFFKSQYGFDAYIGMDIHLMDSENSLTAKDSHWNSLYNRVLNNESISINMELEKDNSTQYHELKFNPILIENKIMGAVMTSNNISSKKRQELELKRNLEEKQTLAIVASTIQHGILILSKDLNIEWSNKHFQKSTGYSSKEAKGQSPFELLNGVLTDLNKNIIAIEKMQRGKVSSYETILYTKNNEPIWTMLSTSPVHNDKGEIIRHILICLDITEQKRSEDQLQMLLNHSQKLNKQLETRDIELQNSIRKLSKQSWEIQISKQHVQKKSGELEIKNGELQAKAKQLEEQFHEIINKNEALEVAKKDLSEKADLLEKASKYKSEFLANMSHELRTPLNSIIILSKLLSENKDSNLNKKQIEFAHVVQKSGTDLLHLINDILDLTKIEAGKIEIEKEEFNLASFINTLNKSIKQIAIDKEIILLINNNTDEDFVLQSDSMRIGQILKNLLINAIKFTTKGGEVRLEINKTNSNKIKFEVIDNGIGIPQEKQAQIFESFKQVDSSISRKFGGTGLGLSISKEFVKLLDGVISVKSNPGVGSTFTFELPIGCETIKQNQKTILIIEDDVVFAKALEKMAFQEGFKTEICHRGDTGYIRICNSKPDAILLDMNIPGIDGWSLLKRIRENKDISHIPVHVVSGARSEPELLQKPLVSWVEKPTGTSDLAELFSNLNKSLENSSKVLVIEDSPEQGMILRQMLKKQGVSCEIAETGKDGIEHLAKVKYDCIILDLNLPDSDGMQLLKKFKEEPQLSNIPVIVYSSKELNPSEKAFLRDYASSYINKNSQNEEILIEETTLFLQSVKEQKKRNNSPLQNSVAHKMYKGKKILVVDDDERNIFALTSLLEIHGMEIHAVSSGEKAIKYLESNPATDMVLMDIMMPEMDGYEATRIIRSQERFKQLPIIALSAKAMKGDRDISLANGLNEHITKPIQGNSLDVLFNNFFQ